jgi:uncharacterized RDD family membrane protein YckC
VTAAAVDPEAVPPLAATSPRRAWWTAAGHADPAERVAAWLIDLGIFWVVWASGVILLIETGELGPEPRVVGPRPLAWLAVVWALSRGYEALSLRRWGSTAGRRVLGIEVRGVDGRLPGRRAAVVRAVARTPSVLALGAGVWPLWADPPRPAWHDRVAGTEVVRVTALEPVDDPEAPAGRIGLDDAPADATERAIREASPGVAELGWLRAVAEQTAARLDVAAPSWRRADDPLMVRQRAFCLLLAALARRYPVHRRTLAAVVDRHAALDDLGGDRMRRLDELLDEPDRARRWVGLPETASVRVLVDAPAEGQPGMRARR